MKKRLLMLLTVVLSVLCLVCLLTMVAGAEDNATPIVEDQELRIDYGALVVGENVYLRYFVTTETYSADEITLLVWTTPEVGKDAYVYGSHDDVATYVGNTTVSGIPYAAFDYTKLPAKKMTDYVYVRAYIPATEDEPAKYSALVKYSVLQYCYTVQGKISNYPSTDAKLLKLVNAMLSYGAAAQDFLNYKTDWLATDSFYEVIVKGGTLPDGATSGLYKEDSKLVITANAPKDGYKFAGWQNAAGEIVSTDAAYEITVGEANETYTATYEEEVKYSKGLAFTSNGDGTCYVSGIDACMDTDLLIPEISPDGDAVTAIGAYAFRYNTDITSVYLPDSITTIQSGGFFGCSSLTAVAIPEGVETINNNAFYGCTSLTEIHFPGTLTSLGIAVLSNCTSLETITVAENNAVYLGKGNCLIERSTKTLLAGCKTSIIPDDGSVTTIGYKAFEYCTGLENISVPACVTHLDDDAFYKCTGLKEITIPGVSILDGTVFDGCSSLVSIVIPEGVRSIEVWTFNGCSSLESITIPESVTSISHSAFPGCSKLTVVNYAGTEEKWNAINIGINNDYLTAAKRYYNCNTGGLELGLIDGENAYEVKNYAGSATNVIIPDTFNGLPVTKIADRAFYGCKNITDVSIPNSVTIIGQLAFANCVSLENLTIPDSVKRIDYSAFSGCDLLIEIENGVHYVDRWVIDCNSSATTVKLRDTTIGIAYEGFAYCSNLTTVTLNANCELKYIGEMAFYNCPKLTSMSIPDSVVSVGMWAFDGCSQLVEVVNGVSYVGNWLVDCEEYMSSLNIRSGTVGIADYECWNLDITTLTIPYGVKYIGSNTFAGANYLTSVSIPSTVVSIGEFSFSDCRNIKKITVNASNPVYYSTGNCLIDRNSKTLVLGCSTSVIPTDGSITRIGNGAFQGSALKEIIIPQSVTAIGLSAFASCNNLTSITFDGTIAQWNAISKASGWNYGISATQVQCSNGIGWL